jgi:hypothetical protein
MEKQGKRLNLNLESSKKGQALVELAVFGSILLFCLAMLIQYGLDANYQQQVQMEAFRKTQRLAFYKDGLGASTSLVVIKDKAMPDPRDQWGFAERQPIVGAGSVTWNTNLAASSYVRNYTDAPDAQDLPTLYFEVDRADTPAEASAPVPNQAGNQVFGFYTARFERLPCPAQIRVVFPDKSINRTSEYQTVIVNRSDIRVMRIEGGFGEDIDVYTDGRLLMQPYFLYQGMKYKISDADVDGDGKLETIIAANVDASGNNMEFFYIDSHEGKPNSPIEGTPVVCQGGIQPQIQIDSDYTYIDPQDRVLEGGVLRPVTPTDRQGLLNDFAKTIAHSGTRITKTEVGGNITSQTNINAQQTVIHKIRLNNGQVLEIPANFRVNGNFYDNWR